MMNRIISKYINTSLTGLPCDFKKMTEGLYQKDLNSEAK